MVRAAARSRDQLVRGVRTTRSAATSSRPSVAGSRETVGATAGSAAPAASWADGPVALAPGAVGCGEDDRATAWLGETEEAAGPRDDVQPTHARAQRIAATRRIPPA